MSLSQLPPVNPLAHVHVYDPTPSMHVAPFLHGLGFAQSSMFFSQLVPLKPMVHLQLYLFSKSVH